jgi:peptide/nickel transport system substrate-binding protein
MPWRHNKPVRRATLLWVGSVSLVILLSFIQLRALKPFYMQYAGRPGGTYTEGVVGSITTINPILAESGANADASRLVFSGLTRYNRDAKLEGDLAKTWTVSPDGRSYTFTLRPGIKWHDDQTLTSADVAFTIARIQNPDTRSPMASAWQGVEVATPDANIVILTLPVRYDAFLNSTTVGILPKHILQDTPANQLRVSEFNQAPIGSGPFMVKDFDTENGSVAMDANQSYFRGKPQLDSMVLKVYATQEELQSAFRKRQVMGMARSANSKGTSYGRGSELHSLSIPEEVALFMRTTSPLLSDAKVRNAIAAAVDRNDIIKTTLSDEAQPLVVPALSSQLPAAKDYKVPEQNVEQAKKMLDEAGWKQKGNATRLKGGESLRLTLVTASNDDYQAVATRLSKQLDAIGVSLNVQTYDATTLQRSYITARNYDVLLYGLNAGADLDPYPYWHSSQAKAPGLNVSQYSSATADKALVSARSTTDSRVRQVRLKSFLDTWLIDAPAVMLYTPNYLYITQDDVQGIQNGEIVTAADRFYDVQKWTVRSEPVPRI